MVRQGKNVKDTYTWYRKQESNSTGSVRKEWADKARDAAESYHTAKDTRKCAKEYLGDEDRIHGFVFDHTDSKNEDLSALIEGARDVDDSITFYKERVIGLKEPSLSPFE